VLVFGVSLPHPRNSRSPGDLGLQSETVRFTGDDGVSLEGWVVSPPDPKGTVLLFHGYAASKDSLLDEAKTLHELGFATLLVDFRGSGGSAGDVTTIGYREALDVAAATRFARTRDLTRPLILYGKSMGGAAVLRAIAHHEVKPDAIIVESVFGTMLGAARNRFSMMGVPSFPAADLLTFWGGALQGFWGFSHCPAEYARGCDVPALVLHGALDRHARPDEARLIHDRLRGPKQLVLFPEGGHYPLLLNDASRWRETVRRFLDERR
jgi:hypothetical protein